MNKIVVETRDLVKQFGHFTAVDRVSLQIWQGEIFGFLGANGAGKTTFIRMLCGILQPTSGEAHVLGYDVGQESEQIKRHIGYVSQRFSLYPDLTVAENFDFFGGVYRMPRPLLEERKEMLLERFGLRPFAGMLTGKLPLGFKQRAALACALLHDPPLLFLDEPTSGVDPKARRHFWEEINRLAAEGKTLFVTTHYLEEAEYCNRIAIIDRGRIVAEGPPGALKQEFGSPTIQDVFVSIVSGGEEP